MFQAVVNKSDTVLTHCYMKKLGVSIRIGLLIYCGFPFFDAVHQNCAPESLCFLAVRAGALRGLEV
jgi:hypothetical protein